MGIYFFESGKETGDRVRIHKDQIHITIKKKNVLNLLANIIKDHKESDKDEDTFLIEFAGELTK